MHRLENPVRDYDWGSPSVIPALLGRPADGTPQAELWIGAHPDSPSRLVQESDRWQPGGPAPTTLVELIEADPVGSLGREVVAAFGARLPYLLKVLAVERPLSLQAHPSLQQARAGFAAEEDAGVTDDAPDRTYRDDNHKPEMLCAVTAFDALCGFRPVDETVALLRALDVAGLRADVDRLAAGEADLADLVRTWLTLDRERLPGVVAELGRSAAVHAADDGEHAAAAATLVDLARRHPTDGGVLVAALLNRVRLQPGEAVFLAAGNLHAYLHGTGVEIMASSDNVLRGGLTSKHVDVDGLLSILDATPGPPAVVRPVNTEQGESYPVPVSDFALDVLRPADGQAYDLPTGSPQLLLALEGTAHLTQGDERLELPRGRSVFVGANERAVRVAGSGVVVLATVGSVAHLR